MANTPVPNSLKDRLSETIKASMKGGDKDTLMYARSLHAAVRKKEIDDRVDLDEGAFMKIVQTSAKQRQDSIDQFRAGGREDLVAKESAELKFLQSFLPAQMGEAEIRALVEAAVTESKVDSVKGMGAVMKLLLPKVQGKADGKIVSQLVNQVLKERFG